MTEGAAPFQHEHDPPRQSTTFERLRDALINEVIRQFLHGTRIRTASAPSNDRFLNVEGSIEIAPVVCAVLTELRTLSPVVREAIDDAVRETLEHDETHTFPSEETPQRVVDHMMKTILAEAGASGGT